MLQAKIVMGYITLKENTLEPAVNQAIKELKQDGRIIKKVDVSTTATPQGVVGISTIIHEEYDPMDYL